MPDLTAFLELSAEDVEKLHKNADTDVRKESIHHTLGRRPSQASPGNHVHDGQDSDKIPAKNIDWGSGSGVIPAVRTGPTSERNTVTPVYWQFWLDTTDGHTYVGSRSGTWRRFSGQATDPAAAWANNQTSGTVINVERSPIFTLPTVLEADEWIMATATSVGTGFGFMAGAGLIRNPGSTQYTCRFLQVGAATTNALSIVWMIVRE